MLINIEDTSQPHLSIFKSFSSFSLVAVTTGVESINIILGSTSCFVIYASLVATFIQSNHFLEWVGTEETKEVKKEEEWSHDSNSPCDDEKDSTNLSKEEASIAASHAPRVEPTEMVNIITVCNLGP